MGKVTDKALFNIVAKVMTDLDKDNKVKDNQTEDAEADKAGI